MVQIFDYGNMITNKDIIKAKNKVDELIKTENYCKTVHTYQTWANLYQYSEFKIFYETFITSCFLYLNQKVNIKRERMWCYVDCARNNLKKNRDELWHEHSENGRNKLSGIFYLINRRKELTEFKNIDHLPYKSFSWYIYPSSLLHRPPKIKSIRNRYTIAANLEF